MDIKPNRRWFCFSLRTLLALVAIACVGFGWLGLKMREAQRQKEALEAASLADIPTFDMLVDPGDMRNFAEVGRSYYVGLTGTKDGDVFGTDAYTLDSKVSAAAVHAGVAEVGRGVVVKVTVGPPLGNYVGSTRHGVKSYEFKDRIQAYRSYRFEAAPTAFYQTATGEGYYVNGPTGFWFGPLDTIAVDRKMPEKSTLGDMVEPDPGNLSGYRGINGSTHFFDVTGDDRGSSSMWGTGIYTDDSKLSAAAIHAGALEHGERGIVAVTIMPGRLSYEGSAQNGVSSRDWGAFDGSYRVEPKSMPYDPEFLARQQPSPSSNGAASPTSAQKPMK